MDRARLTEIGYILVAAGTDEGYITLNRADVDHLGLIGCKEKITITKVAPRMMGYLQAGDLEKLKAPEDELIERLAVEPIHLNDENGDEADVRSYNVNVGVAIKACEKLIGSLRSIPGRRQRDVPLPKPVEEPVSV